MSKRSPEELYRVGLEAIGLNVERTEMRLLRAFAAMLSQAVAPSKPKPKGFNLKSGVALQLELADKHAEELYAALRNQCGPYCISQPKSAAWIPALSKAIAELEDYSPADVQRLVSWLHSGATKDWPTPLNVGHIAKHLARFVGEARKWSGIGAGRANPFSGAIPKKM